MDIQYQRLPYRLTELEHRYGPGIHVISSPFLMTLLARLCAKGTIQPEVNRLVKAIYQHLIGMVVSAEFPRKAARIPTRMIDKHPEGVYEGEVMDPDVNVLCVDIVRAGMIPSQVCFDALTAFFAPGRVRQDHVFMNRRVNERQQVEGVDLSGSKIGGPIENPYLVIPDPMGATGGSMSAALDLYRREAAGGIRKAIAIHLIITPEYLRRVRAEHPDLVVYAIRLDRGLSPPDVLRTVPGERWAEERGLNDRQYIVPGGGGFGEVLNNALW
jgi:uracil phosphoribosyltransferase